MSFGTPPGTPPAGNERHPGQQDPSGPSAPSAHSSTDGASPGPVASASRPAMPTHPGARPGSAFPPPIQPAPVDPANGAALAGARAPASQNVFARTIARVRASYARVPPATQRTIVLAAIATGALASVYALGFVAGKRAAHGAADGRLGLSAPTTTLGASSGAHERSAHAAASQSGSNPSAPANSAAVGATGAAAPHAPAPSPSVFGNLTRGQVNRVLQANLPAVRRCYDSLAAQNPGLTGRVRLRLTINERGRVVSARATETLAAQPAVGVCMEGIARAMIFPRPTWGQVTVSWPIDLGP